MTWYPLSNTTFSGPVAAGATGTTLQNGWIDNSVAGDTYSINSSNFLTSIAQTDGAPWNTRMLLRPPQEDVQDSSVCDDFCLPGAKYLEQQRVGVRTS